MINKYKKIISNHHPYKNYYYRDKNGLRQGQALYHFYSEPKFDMRGFRNGRLNGIKIQITS